MIRPNPASTVYAPPGARNPWPLSSSIGHERLRIFSLARWALVEALRLAQARGKTVLLPDFICRDVLASLVHAGAVPAFYPVDRNLEPAVDPADLPPAAAVICVNYFGFPQDLSPFQDYCRRARALLIEDNAHGLLSRDAQGRPLGSRAPLGLLSMRKTLPLRDGGALAVNDAQLWLRACPQLPAGPPQAATAFTRRRRLLRGLSRWIGPGAMAAAIHGARRLRQRLTGSALPPDDPDCERSIPLSPEPSQDALGPFQNADPQEEVLRRRELYLFCEKILSSCGVEPVFPVLPEGTAPYLYPYRASGQAAERAESILKKNGLSSLPWPALPSAVASSAAPFHACLRGVHFLW